MYVSNVTSTSNVQDSTSKGQSTGASSIEFSLSEYENKDPREITFHEYKSLTKEDIEKLYPKEEMPQQYEKAISLHTKASGTHDEILNEVLFDKEIASDDSEFDKRVSHMLDFVMNTQEMIARFEISLQKTEQYIKDNNITFEGDSPKDWIGQFSKIHSQIEKETVVPEYQKTMTKDEMFEVFENNKSYAEQLIEYYNYTPEDEEYQYKKYMIAYEESIMAEYEKRVAEQESSLSGHQSNQSASYAIAQAQEAKDKEQETKKAEQNSATEVSESSSVKDIDEGYYERIRKLLEDIKSVMRTGLTVDELNQMKELLAQIQKFKAKDDPSLDDEIGALVKQLEEMILAYQKRISGEVVKESEDESSVKNDTTKTEASKLDKSLDELIQALEELQSRSYKDKSDKEEDDRDHGDKMSSQDDFISALLNEGYSEEEANKRADIYERAGLFSSYSGLESIFSTELFGVSFSSNPTYKKALLDAFDQMDTEQLNKVSTELGSRYNIDMEELKKRIPENLQVSDALLHGFDEYLGYQFGSPDQVFGMFDKMMDQANTLQRLTGEDQSELMNGINKVISAYTQNLTLSARSGNIF